MGRGKQPTSQVLRRSRRRARQRDDDERAEVVSVTVWVQRSREEPTLADLSVVATGYDGTFRSDFEITEADGLAAAAVPFRLEALRGILNRDLARAIARDLDIPYDEPRSIAPQSIPPK